MALATKNYHFLQGGGEMGALTRDFDWSRTSVGSPDEWPQSLRTVVAMILSSKFPMFLWWGEDLVQFYNDAYRPSLGNTGKHPAALGQKGADCWPEIWDVIYPLIKQVKSTGEATWSEDQLIPIYRNGKIEDVYWTFGYSAIYDDADKVAGVFVVCTETTEKVNNLRQLRESKDALDFAIEATELGTWDIDPVARTIKGNDRLKEWFGIPRGAEVTYDAILDTIPAAERVSVEKAVETVLQFSSGGRYEMEHISVHPVTGQERLISAKGRVWFNEAQVAIRFNGTMQDITERKQAEKSLEESEKRFRNLIVESTIATALLTGEDMVIEIANAMMLRSWGRDESIIGKKLLDVMPEIAGQRFPKLLKHVFITGETYNVEDSKVEIFRNGVWDTRYRDFSYKAVRNETGEIYSVLVTSVDVTEKVLSRQKLLQSEERFQGAVQALRGILWTNNADGEMMGEQPGWAELTGQSYEEYQGYGWAKAVHPDDAQPTLDAWLEAVRGHKTFVFEHRVKKGNGEWGEFSIRAVPLFDEENNIREWVGVHTDITDQHEAERALVESEQRVRAVVESAPFAIAVYTGREMRVELANQAIMDIWGKGYNVIGKLFTEVLPELGSQEVFDQILEVFDSGIAYHTRYQRLDLVIDGKSRPFWFNYSFTPLFDAEGNVYGVMNTGVDNTDLVLAKLKVEENEKNMRNTILKAPVAMCIFRGADHVVEIANDRMIELWGHTADEVMNKPIFDGLPEIRDQGFEQLLDGVFTTGEAFIAQGVPVTLPRDGKIETVYVNFVYEAFREADNTISGVLAVATDVTDQVLARQKIEEIVNARTKQLAEANESLQRSNAELAQFAYIASHDLQEPVRKVSTFVQMLEQTLGDIDERSRGYLGKIGSASARMTALIRDVLSYSQLSKETEVMEPVNLQEVVENILGDFELLIEQKQAVIAYSGLPTISAIPLQMSQLFGNLISNALKFTREGVQPILNITATQFSLENENGSVAGEGTGGYYNIEVRDNGIGFKQEYADQIFNIFQRLHGKSEYSGTGIGLAMCKKIAQNHHGDIYATGSTEDGAVFNVILPVGKPGVAV